MLGEVLWVVVVIAFWAFVFALMLTLSRWAARTRDGEEALCALPAPPMEGSPQPS